MLKSARFYVLPYWKTLVIVLTPLIFLPLLILFGGPEAKTGYVVILMAIFWMTEALPICITSLIPIALFPILGVASTGTVVSAYLRENGMLFLGSLMLATSIEYCNLHRRIALRVLLLFGGGARWILLGFMIIAAGLSMWVANVATTVMLIPIVDSLFMELAISGKKEDKISSEVKEILVKDSAKPSNPAKLDSESALASVHQLEGGNDWVKMRTGVFLSIAYSANLGGTGSIIGTGVNLILTGLLNDLYGNETGLNFSSWMVFAVPGLIIEILLAWLWLQYLFIGFEDTADDERKREIVKRVIRRKYEELGPISFHELSVLIFFIICVLLWFFRNPQFITGWGDFFPVKIGDATTVISILILLFVFPANCPTFGKGPWKTSPSLLNWKFVQEKIPWGTMFLLGAGYAVSDACRISGLSKLVSQQLIGLQVLPPVALLFILCIMTAMITEIATNGAVANVLLPIVVEMAKSSQIHPLYLMIPVTIASSYAFMLPVGSITNALVFEASKMKTSDMVRAGIVMNLICVAVLCVNTIIWGNYLFDLETFPKWADGKINTG